MDKTAQKRDRLHKFREKVDIFGRGAEALSPTFAALMEKLRETDDKIREALLEDDVKLKDVLKSARQNFNRREYMQSVADISTFHEKMEQVVDTLKVLELDVDAAHHEFLGTDLPPEAVEKLKRVQERIKAKKTKKAATKVWIEKHAGYFGDLWYALTSDRGKALRGWEKRYPSKMKQLKSHTSALINKSDSLFNVLLSSLKEMSSARGARNLDRYLKAAKKLTDTFNTYNTQYEKYYEDNVDNFLSKLIEKEKAAAALKAEKGEPTEEAKKVKTEETGLGEKEVATPAQETSQEAAPPSDPRSNVPPSSYRQPTPASERPASEVSETVPDTEVDAKPPSHVPDTEVDVKPPSHHESVVPSTETSPPPATSVSPPREPTPSDLYRMVREKRNLPKPPGLPVELRPTLPSAKAPEPTFSSKPPTVNERKQSEFIYLLESLANESPEMMALEINKFAREIQKTNPQTSKKLLAIVEEILDGK